MNAAVAHVLSEYGIDVQRTHARCLDNAGGFSGAQLWRVTHEGRELGLRRWPEEQPDATRLRFIHAVIQHAARRVDFLPVPLSTQRGATFVEHGERLWELTPWLPGEANRAWPISSARLSAALTALAAFHLALADFPSRDATAQPSPALARRLEQVEQLQAGGASKLRHALPACVWPELRPRAARLLEWFDAFAPEILTQLQIALRTSVRLQPCLRDIWSEHVLFRGDCVTGIIDFGALRAETVAGDLARLLGSFVPDDRLRWKEGLAAYQAVRPLDPVELALVEVFDSSQVLLSGLNWLHWILLEQRTFADPAAVLGRIDAILTRLERRRNGRRLIVDGEP